MAGIANALQALIGLVLVVDIVAVSSDLAEYALLGRVQAGASVPDAELVRSDIRQGVIGLVQALSTIAAMVVWLVWFHRAYKNLGPLRAGAPRFTPGWAIGAWFVPVLNLWRPLQMTKDVWTGSDPSGEPPVRHWKHAPMPPLLGFWWFLWIAAQLAYPGFAQVFEAETIPELRASSLRFVIGDTLSVVLDVLAFFVVRTITQRQERRAARLAGAAIP